jgi:hypothetical protein
MNVFVTIAKPNTCTLRSTVIKDCRFSSEYIEVYNVEIYDQDAEHFRRWAAICYLEAHEWIRRCEIDATFKESDDGFLAIQYALEHEAWLHKPENTHSIRIPEEWEIEVLDVSVITGLL